MRQYSSWYLLPYVLNIILWAVVDYSFGSISVSSDFFIKMKGDTMNKINSKEFIVAAFIRAFKTMCQTALSMLTVGMAMEDVNWMQLISISLVAGIISMLTSFATGLPEASTSGEIIVNTNIDDDNVLLGMNLDADITPEYIEKLKSIGHVNLRIK